MNIHQIFAEADLGMVQSFLDRKQEENLFLDFKRINKPDFSDKSDRQNLATALSGFANSAGGLIFWGIDARQNADRIDCATALFPINPIQQFLSNLNNYSSQFVTPFVDGVQHRAIMEDRETGYAVTLVPESISGPHMAKAGLDRYFKRNGSSFLRMEHFDIEDMFGRRKKPALELRWQFKHMGTMSAPTASQLSSMSGMTIQRFVKLGIELSLTNVGRGSAFAPYLSVSPPNPFSINPYGLGGTGFGLDKIANTSRSGAAFCTPSFVLHPGITIDVAIINADFTAEQLPEHDFRMPYTIAAQDMRLVDGELVIPSSELQAILLNYF